MGHLSPRKQEDTGKQEMALRASLRRLCSLSRSSIKALQKRIDGEGAWAGDKARAVCKQGSAHLHQAYQAVQARR
jgi:hypothetical protein